MFEALQKVRSGSLINRPHAHPFRHGHRVELITPSYLPTRNLHFAPVYIPGAPHLERHPSAGSRSRPIDRANWSSCFFFNPAIAPWRMYGACLISQSTKVLATKGSCYLPTVFMLRRWEGRQETSGASIRTIKSSGPAIAGNASRLVRND